MQTERLECTSSICSSICVPSSARCLIAIKSYDSSKEEAYDENRRPDCRCNGAVYWWCHCCHRTTGRERDSEDGGLFFPDPWRRRRVTNRENLRRCQRR